MKLALLLEEASTASPAHRIEWRDRIAPFGPRAIERVRPWLSKPVLAAAVEVLRDASNASQARAKPQMPVRSGPVRRRSTPRGAR
jgi:hypothetical protein